MPRRHDPDKARERYIGKVTREGKTHRIYRNLPKQSPEAIARGKYKKQVRLAELEHKRKMLSIERQSEETNNKYTSPSQVYPGAKVLDVKAYEAQLERLQANRAPR